MNAYPLAQMHTQIYKPGEFWGEDPGEHRGEKLRLGWKG